MISRGQTSAPDAKAASHCCDAKMSSNCDAQTLSNSDAKMPSSFDGKSLPRCDAKTLSNSDAPPLPSTPPPIRSSGNHLSDIIDVLTRKSRQMVRPDGEVSSLQNVVARPEINVTDVDAFDGDASSRQTKDIETTNSRLSESEKTSQNLPEVDITDTDQTSIDQIDEEIYSMRLATDLVSWILLKSIKNVIMLHDRYTVKDLTAKPVSEMKSFYFLDILANTKLFLFALC